MPVSTQDIAANFKINSLVKLTEVAVTAINIEVLLYAEREMCVLYYMFPLNY